MDENNKISKLKEILGNKKYRALIILIIYFFFFLILFLVFDFNNEKIENPNNNDTNSNDINYNLSQYDIYEFSTILNINDNIYNIDGKRYKNKYEFMFENETYTIYETAIHNYENINKEVINTFLYNPSVISNLIEKSELISETKIMSDSSIIREYSISLEKYLQLFNYNLDNYNNDKLLIKTVELDDKIISVDLNLSNFYKYYDEMYQVYKIEITYNDIGNVLEF